MESFRLPVEVARLPNGTFVASCAIVEGCHAEGRTAGEAIDRMEDIVKATLNMKSPYAVLAHPHASPLKTRRRCPVL